MIIVGFTDKANLHYAFYSSFPDHFAHFYSAIVLLTGLLSQSE